MSLPFTRVVDLAVPMTSMDTPVYPGYPQPLRTSFTTLRDDGYASYVWSFVEHVSTHVDAPIHMVKGGTTVDRMPLTRYIGRGVVLDFSKRPKRFQIKRADVEKAMAETGHAGEVGKGWVVLFYVGYTAKNRSPDWMEHPDITKEAAAYLVGLGVEAVGVDAPGPDHPPFDAHHTFLPKDVVIFENLANLDRLVGKEFFFVGTPIALEGGTAGITRPVALLM